MTQTAVEAGSPTLSERIAPHLPLLRRYARALTGSQSSGDAYVVALLEALIADRSLFNGRCGDRVGLYAAFQRLWASTEVDAPLDMGLAVDPLAPASADTPEAVAHQRLERLTPRSRQALLLTAVEGFSQEDAAAVMGVDADEVGALIEDAVAELRRQTAARVLIIEDEPIIAMDIEAIVQELGHTVVDIAATRDAAVAAAAEHQPELVLADIQLADGSSGIDAVRDILGELTAPVIFITAFPERLLTGSRPEPTYLISKPFRAETVQAAISQALFFRRNARVA
jgi:DNA-directed RNA polymerase specialized sigma24 family protein/CheY-like chemotaxis protein